MKLPKLPIILAGCLLLPLALNAQTTFLSVDINASTSNTQSGFNGIGLTVGTGVGPFTTSFTGLSTDYTAAGTVGLTLTFPGGGNYTARDRTATDTDTGSFTNNGIYRDFVNSSSNGATTIGFSGLLANTTYQLRFYAYDDNNSRTMTFTDFTSGSAGTGESTGSVSYTSSFAFTGAETDNLRFSTLITATSSATGTLNIRNTPNTGASVLNGFEIISVIPEPSSYATIFGAITLVGAMTARRRRR